MLTDDTLRKIHALLPGGDARSYALRALLRTLARNGGAMSLAEVRALLGDDSPSLIEGRTWHGVRLTGCGMGATLSLAPWVCAALGLAAAAKLPGAADPLDGIRAAVARCRNVATVAEGLEHAGQYRAWTVTSPADMPRLASLPRDCAEIDC